MINHWLFFKEIYIWKPINCLLIALCLYSHICLLIIIITDWYLLNQQRSCTFLFHTIFPKFIMLGADCSFRFLYIEFYQTQRFFRIFKINYFLFVLWELTKIYLLSKYLDFRKNYIIFLNPYFDKIVRCFTNNPYSFFYFNHFIIPKFIIKLKNFVITRYFDFTSYKITWYIKF